MTQSTFCRTLISLFLLLPAFISGQSAIAACSLPSDFPQAYREIYEFTKSIDVSSIRGVDECLGNHQQPLNWQINCDEQGRFKSLSAEIFLLPKVKLSFNEKSEFSLEYFYFTNWNYSKVDPSELADVFVKEGRELKIIYTTQSTRKVHMTLVKNGQDKLITFETLVYKMNIGSPTLETKFSCFEI